MNEPADSPPQGVPSPMDRKYIDDQHVVARYLADQLPDAEREAFEAYYLEHQDVVRELEAAARFKVGMMQLRRSGELEGLLQPAPRRWSPYLAAAAAVAAVAVGAAFVAHRASSPQPLLLASATAIAERHGDALSIASVHTLMRTRSVQEDVVVDLPGTPQLIALRILPEVNAEPARYEVSLLRISDAGSREIAAIGALVPDPDGFVPVYLNAAKLVPGRYQVTLSADAGTSGASEPTVFTLRLR